MADRNRAGALVSGSLALGLVGASSLLPAGAAYAVSPCVTSCGTTAPLLGDDAAVTGAVKGPRAGGAGGEDRRAAQAEEARSRARAAQAERAQAARATAERAQAARRGAGCRGPGRRRAGGAGRG